MKEMKNPLRRHANSPTLPGDGRRRLPPEGHRPQRHPEPQSEDKPREQKVLATGVQALANLQDMLYAQNRWAVLLILNA